MTFAKGQSRWVIASTLKEVLELKRQHPMAPFVVGNTIIGELVKWTDCVSGRLPTRTIPHHTGIGPDEWWSWWRVVQGTMVLLDTSLALFSVENCAQWGVVLEPTGHDDSWSYMYITLLG